MTLKLLTAAATAALIASSAAAQVSPNVNVYVDGYGNVVDVDVDVHVQTGGGNVPNWAPALDWAGYCALLNYYGEIIHERPLYHDEWLYPGESCWIDGYVGTAIY